MGNEKENYGQCFLKLSAMFFDAMGNVFSNVLSPCSAGLDPAEHPVKGVGTQRVALACDSMGLRIKSAKTREGLYK